ncbi:MAG TPA: hypothetical protein VG073_05260 [Gaiellaceae bacterium]|nr:hypothetical protein [Gaiellaceae bacterium]
MAAQQLTVKVEPFGAKQSVHDRVVRGLVAGGAVKPEHRLVALRLEEPTRKSAKRRPYQRYHAVFCDYAGNRAIHAKGPLEAPG